MSDHPSETGAHPSASYIPQPENPIFTPTTPRHRRNPSHPSDERIGGTKPSSSAAAAAALSSSSSSRRPGTRKDATFASTNLSSRGENPTMQRSTSPQMSPDSVHYTRTGRISKAKKGLKVHHCGCGRVSTTRYVVVQRLLASLALGLVEHDVPAPRFAYPNTHDERLFRARALRSLPSSSSFFLDTSGFRLTTLIVVHQSRALEVRCSGLWSQGSPADTCSRRHQKNHATDSSLQCDYPGCGKPFFRLDLLQRHQDRQSVPRMAVRSGNC